MVESGDMLPEREMSIMRHLMYFGRESNVFGWLPVKSIYLRRTAMMCAGIGDDLSHKGLKVLIGCPCGGV
jgi:hypothetical protein